MKSSKKNLFIPSATNESLSCQPLMALSLFANVGIAETYLEECGIEVVVANELHKNRANFYKHLYPECNMICGDITDKTVYDEIIKQAKKAKVEFIIATPPCQGMSLAGNMNPNDERNYLIKYAVDAIVDIEPKYVFLENVSGQLITSIEYQGETILIPEYIKKRLSDIYEINTSVINTADFSIPQNRKRAIVLMSKKNKKMWEFPEKDNKIITLKMAFNGIPSLSPIIRDKKECQILLPENTEEALNFHKWHKPPVHSWHNIESMLYTPTGKTAFDNEFYYPKRKKDGKRVSGYSSTYHRMYWDKPASTVTMSNGAITSQNNVHPGHFWKKHENGNDMYTDPRVLTIYELLIVSSLPLNWDIPEGTVENLIRHVIGEGIPPLLVKKICGKIT